jgi:hypothetical protein
MTGIVWTVKWGHASGILKERSFKNGFIRQTKSCGSMETVNPNLIIAGPADVFLVGCGKTVMW